MKVRTLVKSLLGAVVATGLLFAASANAHGRDDHRHDDRHDYRSEHYRGGDDRRYYHSPREYGHYYREGRYYYERPYRYQPYYYPRRSYYDYGYPYGYGPGVRSSVTVTLPLF